MCEYLKRKSENEKKWREDHPEKMREYAERRRAKGETPEQKAQRAKTAAAYYQTHKAERREYMREYMRLKRAAERENV